MTGHGGFAADGRVLLQSADDVDSAAASLSLAQQLMWDNPNGPAASDFSVLGRDVAAEYTSFAVELTHLLHRAPGYVFEVADNLRATARHYVSADVISGANFRKLGE
jgi:hypothetical protein